MATIEMSFLERYFMHHQNVASSSICIRMQFLRKVYGIIGIQLSFVAFVSTIIIWCSGLREFFQSSFICSIVMFIGTMISLFALYTKRFEYPTNYMLLGCFTLCESCTIGTIISFYDTISILISLALTSIIVICLSWFTLQTRHDFTMFGTSLFTFLCALTCGSLIHIFVGGTLTQFILSLAGTILFSMYLVYDTQNIMTKKSPEEYMDAVIQIYLDITRLFIDILRLLQSAEKR